MNRKSPILKIIITSLIVLTILGVVRTTFFYFDTKEMLLSNVKKEAALMKDYMMSVREVYQSQFIKSGLTLDADTLGFLPAHALSKISDNFITRNKNGFYIKNVSQNPRNPNNKADLHESKAIDFFKRDNNAKDYFEKYKENNVEIYQFATPIKIRKRCLSCHGEKKETITTIQNLYNTAFGYKVGDIKGIVSIKVHQNSIYKKLNDFILKEIVFTVTSIILIYIILIILYKKTSTSINEANQYALTDALTGLKNRHYLKLFSNKICDEFVTEPDKQFAVAFIDIDHFKKINDTFGHDVGDYVLQTFAKKLQNSVRNQDILCRYGGEEFLLIITNITHKTVLEKLEELRKTIEKTSFSYFEKSLPNITISIGVSFNTLDKTLQTTIKEADKAVYQVKKAGRNNICVYDKSL